MTQGLNVSNNSYGTLAGADMPLIQLKRGWEYIPTAYIGYNGGRQSFNGVSMNQEGGQFGFMHTFIKDKSVSNNNQNQPVHKKIKSIANPN